MARIVNEKKYKLSDGERPKVLLLGNGVPRAFGGESWDSFLDIIKDKNRFPDKASYYEFPQAMKAVMLSSGKLGEKIRETVKNDFSVFTRTSADERIAIREYTSLRFDHILTTNYSYEIEVALLEREDLKEKQIRNLMAVTGVEHPQIKYLLNTFNLVNNDRIWHIHGEARKPGSMILGHFYYGNLLAAYKSYLDKAVKERIAELKNEGTVTIRSWLDAFIYGDVYIVGFGMDTSEIDIWWLLEYRAGTNLHGKAVYFEPLTENNAKCPVKDDGLCDRYNQNECPLKEAVSCKHSAGVINKESCKEILLSTYEVDVRNLDFVVHNKEDYRSFYEKVLEELRIHLC